MMKSLRLSRISLNFLRPKPLSLSSPTTTLSLLHSKPKLPTKIFSIMKPSSQSFSTTLTKYPLQYDLIIHRPDSQSSSPSQSRRRAREIPQSNPTDPSESEPDAELGFDDWVDRKLTSPASETEKFRPILGEPEMDKSKRKYYNKRRRRMYGSDSEDERRRQDDEGYVELKPEVVEFRTLHKREEELYFHDTFAYPWEKEKHYKMVYQLEKKYFPDQCFDKAFLEPGESNAKAKAKAKAKSQAERERKGVGKSGEKKREKVGDGRDEKGLVFFEDGEERKEEREKGLVKDVKIDFSEKKVEEFFKCLKKVPNKDGEVANAEPFVSSRSTGLPSKWDSPTGNVVLVNKPKG